MLILSTSSTRGKELMSECESTGSNTFEKMDVVTSAAKPKKEDRSNPTIEIIDLTKSDAEVGVSVDSTESKESCGYVDS
ncbi:hypothetical protein RIF29_37816 [Crotalaria pallida]|uniref:Uncharacterized protein n=1 Tax=Crotalaria pallida TaxID=3830 RepID=A0AAN9HP16_CROPI